MARLEAATRRLAYRLQQRGRGLPGQKPAPGLLMHLAATLATEPTLPPAYSLRTLRQGDRPSWLALLNASGAFGPWDGERLEREMTGLAPGCQFFVEAKGELLAAAGVLDRPLNGRPAWEIGWVVRRPDAKGHRLGEAAVVAATRAAAALPGNFPVYLYTDDHRLTAIALYLALGFVPGLRAHRSYPARWEAVFRSLALRSASRAAEDSAQAPEHLPASVARQ